MEWVGGAPSKWLTKHHPALAGKVVFMTGGAFTPMASEYVAHVGNPRLEKPYESATLKHLVSEMIAAGVGKH